MGRRADLGEFEQLVLLAVLRLEESAYAPDIAGLLEKRAGREMSRGTLYAALDRLESRGFLRWDIETSSSGRAGRRKRRFVVTDRGTRALAMHRSVLLDLWEGIEHRLVESER